LKNARVENFNSVSVFKYLDPSEFLCAILEEKKVKNPSFSLRAWSKQLGFKNPSYLSSVLKGKRKLKLALANKIAESLQLTRESKNRFELLILRMNATSEGERELYSRLLSSLDQARRRTRLEHDKFQIISDWYHLVILEMVSLTNFRSDLKYLIGRLGPEVTAEKVEKAVRRLVRLKLLFWDSEGILRRSPFDPHAGDSVPSDAIRQHHTQLLERARLALSEQPLDERDFRGSTFVLSRTKIEEARRLIRGFHEEMRNLAGPGDGDQVYRFSTQLFRMTREPKS
jgi:uncharacterized protein (TIGR02147 family)